MVVSKIWFLFNTEKPGIYNFSREHKGLTPCIGMVIKFEDYGAWRVQSVTYHESNTTLDVYLEEVFG